MSKPTKQQRIDQLEQQLAEARKAASDDTTLREELSKALGAPEKHGNRPYYDAKFVVYSWFEIFREIGKLLQRDKEQAQREEIKKLDARIRQQDEEFREHAIKYHPEQNPF
jgi:small-conductance mechanosensitive channel